MNESDPLPGEPIANAETVATAVSSPTETPPPAAEFFNGVSWLLAGYVILSTAHLWGTLIPKAVHGLPRGAFSFFDWHHLCSVSRDLAIGGYLAHVLITPLLLVAGLKWRAPSLILASLWDVVVVWNLMPDSAFGGSEEAEVPIWNLALYILGLASGLAALRLSALRELARAKPEKFPRRLHDCRRAARWLVIACGLIGLVYLLGNLLEAATFAPDRFGVESLDLEFEAWTDAIAGFGFLSLARFLPRPRIAIIGGAALIGVSAATSMLERAWSPIAHPYASFLSLAVILVAGNALTVLLWRLDAAARLSPSRRRRLMLRPRLAFRPIRPRAWATPLLLFVILAIYFAMLKERDFAPAAPDWQRRAWGDSDRILQAFGEPERAFTGALLHGDFVHLASNLPDLTALGLLLESAVGGPGILALFLTECLLDESVGLHFQPGAAAVGSSGFVFALFGALLVLTFKRRRSRDRRWVLFEARWGWLLGGCLIGGVLSAFGEIISDTPWNLGHVSGFFVGLMAGAFLFPSRSGPRARRPQAWRSIAAVGAASVVYVSTISEGTLLSAIRWQLAGPVAGKAAAAGYVMQAQAAIDGRRFEDAIELAERGLRLSPSDPAALLFRAFAYCGLNRHDLAIADYDRILADDPKNVYVIGRRGDSLMAREEFELAAADCRRYLDLSPEDAWGWGQLGHALGKLQRPSEGIEALDKALALKPADPWLRRSRAGLRKDRREYGEAIAEFERLAAERPSETCSWLDLAECREKAAQLSTSMADFASAADAYRRAAELEPKNLYARSMLARCLAEAGAGERAIEEMTKFVADDPTCGYCFLLIGQIHHRMGRWNLAAEAYARAVPLTSEDGLYELHYFRAIALHRGGRDKEADDSWQEASRHPPGKYVADGTKQMRAGLYITRLIESSAPPAFAPAPKNKKSAETKTSSARPVSKSKPRR